MPYFDFQPNNEITIYADATKTLQIGAFHSIPEYHDYWQFWFEWGTLDIAFRPVQAWLLKCKLRTEILTSLLRFDLSLPILFICLRVHK
jgi:hypothetical protein